MQVFLDVNQVGHQPGSNLFSPLKGWGNLVAVITKIEVLILLIFTTLACGAVAALVGCHRDVRPCPVAAGVSLGCIALFFAISAIGGYLIERNMGHLESQVGESV